jgi:hypothetical protein
VGRRGIDIASTWRLFCAPWASDSVGLRSRSLTAEYGEYQWISASLNRPFAGLGSSSTWSIVRLMRA